MACSHERETFKNHIEIHAMNIYIYRERERERFFSHLHNPRYVYTCGSRTFQGACTHAEGTRNNYQRTNPQKKRAIYKKFLGPYILEVNKKSPKYYLKKYNIH